MKKKETKRSRVASDILEGLTELHDAVRNGEALDHRFTVRTVELVLKPRDLSSAEIQTLRAKLGASQEIFGAVLGVSADAVQSWEQGRRQPSEVALRMMHFFIRNPKLFRQQIQMKSHAA